MTPTLRILIVDDSASLRTVIMRYIKESFNESPNKSIDAIFFEAGNGEEAEKVLQECFIVGTPIDVMILDWMMPKMSGHELLKKIRNTEIFMLKPEVVLLTAETYSEQINAVARFNVWAYLTKPFTQQDLAAVFRDLLERGKLEAVNASSVGLNTENAKDVKIRRGGSSDGL